jgi:hypothetical protein
MQKLQSVDLCVPRSSVAQPANLLQLGGFLHAGPSEKGPKGKPCRPFIDVLSKDTVPSLPETIAMQFTGHVCALPVYQVNTNKRDK